MNFRVGIGVKPHMVQIQTASVPNENKKFHCAEDITWNALKQNKSQTWENDHIILMLERITMQKTRYFHVLSVHVGLHSAHACTLHVRCTRAWWMKCPNKHNPFLSFVYYSFNFNFLHFLSVSEIRVAFLKLKKKKKTSGKSEMWMQRIALVSKQKQNPMNGIHFRIVAVVSFGMA